MTKDLTKTEAAEESAPSVPPMLRSMVRGFFHHVVEPGAAFVLSMAAESAALRSALVRYGDHQAECAYPESCTCGWSEMKKKLDAGNGVTG